jgi:DNA-binding response OmpR family regulator
VSASAYRVFVVEDHAATARGLKVFLELAGYIVTIATDLRSALAIAEKASFDVLVCDLNLPDGTGWELMETLRKKAPVRGIVFSAFDEPEHVARSKRAGFDEHVVKGTTPETLLAAIDRVARFELPNESADHSTNSSNDGRAALPERAAIKRVARKSSVRAKKAKLTR